MTLVQQKTPFVRVIKYLIYTIVNVFVWSNKHQTTISFSITYLEISCFFLFSSESHPLSKNLLPHISTHYNFPTIIFKKEKKKKMFRSFVSIGFCVFLPSEHHDCGLWISPRRLEKRGSIDDPQSINP